MSRRTTASVLSCPTEAPDGSRGEGGIFLRASAAVFSLFEGGVYLEPGDLEPSGELGCIWSSRTCWFGCDTFIPGCLWVENGENCAGFAASAQSRFRREQLTDKVETLAEEKRWLGMHKPSPFSSRHMSRRQPCDG